MTKKELEKEAAEFEESNTVNKIKKNAEVDNLETKLNKTIEMIIKLEEIMYEQYSKQNQKDFSRVP